MKDMILFPEDIERLNSVLSQLVMKANLLLAVLINKDGRLLTNQGSLERIDTVSMAALVAGNSASTLAIANLMGEREFSTMYHQGKDKHIYIAAVEENTFLALVFDDRTNIDRVKVFARQFDRQLKHTLFQVYNKSEDMVNLDLDMNYAQYNQAVAAQDFQSSQHAPQDYYQSQQPQNTPHINAGTTPQTNGRTFHSEDNGIHQQNHMQTKQKSDEEGFVFMDPDRSAQKSSGPNDTNYLFLKNKIRESVKRKNEDSQ